ncbi:MAG: signal peptide peptidase SppA, partial [Bacteroidetes bacterium SW_10_40_5]
MKEFLKFTLASMVGFIVANIILFVITIIFLFIGIGSVATMTKGFQSDQQAKIEEKSILKIGFDQPIVERTSDDPFKQVMYALQDQPKPIAISDVLQSIEHAKTDDRIKGVFLDLSVLPASRATVNGIYNKLKSYKSSGKFLYAYGDMMTQQSYYLASLADSIYLQPQGMFIFNGMHSEMTFYKGLFDKLEIEPNVIKMGKYKSAGESFSHKEMTDANREQMNKLLNTFYHTHLEAISQSREIKVSRLKTIADSLMVRNARDAVEQTVGLQKYSKKADDWGQNTADSEIAVIYATGPIGLGGGGDSENIGSKRMSEAIKSARKNEDVEAVVLRVNSPGGSALASDVIWREVKLTKAEKPVIVSMGNLAASGGYYISASADTIVAQPNTITGSIGVIGILMNWQEFFNEKLGVTFDRVKTAKYADLGNPNRPMMEKKKEI